MRYNKSTSRKKDKEPKNLDKHDSKSHDNSKKLNFRNDEENDIKNDQEKEFLNRAMTSKLKPIQVSLLGSVLNRVTSLEKQTYYNPYQLITKAVIENLEYDKLFSPFERRISSMCWQPKKSALVLGGKGGELGFVKNINGLVEDRMIQDFILLHDRVGPEEEYKEIKFDKLNSNIFYGLSIQGQLVRVDLNHFSQFIVRSMDPGNLWFYGLEVDSRQKLVYIGDNRGFLTMIYESSLNDKISFKAHKGKINCIDMHPRNSNLIVTAATGDNSVRLWDVRKLKENNPLTTLNHDKPVNSAFFSSTNGGTILTTDQGSQLRVYCSATFQLERIISHPHRHFQHIIPIRAFWHPLADIIVVGRYPDPKYLQDDKRTVDFINPQNGNIIHQLLSPNGLCLHNKFNYMGDVMASMQSTNIIIWKPKSDLKKNLSKKRRRSHDRSKNDDYDDDDNDEDDDEDCDPHKSQFSRKKKKYASSKKLSSYF